MKILLISEIVSVAEAQFLTSDKYRGQISTSPMDIELARAL